MSETADMARAAMADMLTAVSMSAARMTPGAALQSASSLQATAARLNDALVSAQTFLAAGDGASASVDATRAMSLSDYAARLARLRTIAAQMSAYDAAAHSGNAS